MKNFTRWFAIMSQHYKTGWVRLWKRIHSKRRVPFITIARGNDRSTARAESILPRFDRLSTCQRSDAESVTQFSTAETAASEIESGRSVSHTEIQIDFLFTSASVMFSPTKLPFAFAFVNRNTRATAVFR